MSPLHVLTLAVHMTVTICGADRVSGSELAKAEAIAADAYRDIGVLIEWHEACGDARLTVHLVTSDAADPEGSLSKLALGYAQSGTQAATVLYDRVAAFAHTYHIKRQVLLGYTMAHELGHLLLPPNSHSNSGVMRASLDLERAAARRLRFTPGQGVLIVRRLESPAMTVATN